MTFNRLHLTTVFKDPALLSMIHGAADELGFEVGGMDTPISPDPDTGQPWRERFDALGLAREERHLQTAAYIVCSYLTGMIDADPGPDQKAIYQKREWDVSYGPASDRQ